MRAARFILLLCSWLQATVAQAQDEGLGARASVAPPEDDDGEARSLVTRRDLDERQPRSTPDALGWEPGVAVQQTAHGQASPYVRGLTGQQVVHVFDGVRLNHAIFRQGPNQYFFTVDRLTVAQLEVQRGSASVRWGSDALGGAILATPIRPLLDPENEGLTARPRAFLRYGSADDDVGGRAELELRVGSRTALLAGGGVRDVGLLESGGVVRHRRRIEGTGRGDEAPWVPRFAEERTHPDAPERWRTQLGTGFREGTFDLRLEHQLKGAETLRFVAATYGYLQSDAPRTDQCPPAEAPLDECLTIARLRRFLSTLAIRGTAGPLDAFELIVSHQRSAERRLRERPRSFTTLTFDDTLDTLGLTLRAGTDLGWARLRFGGEGSVDTVESTGAQAFTDLGATFPASRGQYLPGSVYARVGAWAELAVPLHERVTLRGGLRTAFVGARAPADPTTGTAAVDARYGALVGRAGLDMRAHEAVRVVVNADQGFRAPNLDDLTSRQQVGPGFQFENPGLRPEQAWTFEAGVLARTRWLRLDAWTFATLLRRGIQRAVRETADCPPETPECVASRDPFQLVNAGSRSRIFGAEGGVSVFPVRDLRVRALASFAWGEGPSLGDRDAPPGRVPLSRIPPLQGGVEARYRHRPTGLWVGAGLRWARAQTRLAISDGSDPRIPIGGTPGYARVELRAGWRFRDGLSLGLVAENLADAAYRVHGSSVNGPGRSVILWIRGGR
ncbi:MAG: TonB-dependent receptor [Myxococcota bacterium]